MEHLVCVCAASLVGNVVSKETKWSYEKVEIAACVVGRARDCVRHSLAKVLFAGCDGKLTKIPKTGLYFRTCEDGAGWHLIPY